MFETKQHVLPSSYIVTFQIATQPTRMRTFLRFHHIHQPMANIHPIVRWRSAKQDEHILPSAHGAWNRRKRIAAYTATFPCAGLRMLDAATERCAGRFQWWKARWATTTPPSAEIATRLKEPYDKKPSNASLHKP